VELGLENHGRRGDSQRRQTTSRGMQKAVVLGDGENIGKPLVMRARVLRKQVSLRLCRGDKNRREDVGDEDVGTTNESISATVSLR
jgi:hypothetical protein